MPRSLVLTGVVASRGGVSAPALVTVARAGAVGNNVAIESGRSLPLVRVYGGRVLG